MVHLLAVALSLDAGAASHFARLALKCAPGISEQARSRDERRARGALAPRASSGVLRLLRLAFDRAWPLDARAPLAAFPAASGSGGDPRALAQLGDTHAQASLPFIASGSYEGEHWLGTFAVQMLDAREQGAQLSH